MQKRESIDPSTGAMRERWPPGAGGTRGGTAASGSSSTELTKGSSSCTLQEMTRSPQSTNTLFSTITW